MDEHGFVFAPYDDESETILFPINESEVMVEELALHESITTSKIGSNEVGKKKHIQLVEKAIEEIESSNLQKIVVSRKEVMPSSNFKAEEVFQKLLSKYQNALVYCWYHPSVGLWMGASPETLCKVTSGRLITIALAGTQKHLEGQEVKWGAKEIEEQQMVTDYIVEAVRNKVDELEVGATHTVKAGNLLHLKTRIEGDLKSQSPLKDIVSELHPTPAVCGLPKNDAQTFLKNKEGYNRKFYTGYLGELNYDGIEGSRRDSHLFVNLRCMEFVDEQVCIYVGGGITADSDAQKEWEETVNKTLTIKSVL